MQLNRFDFNLLKALDALLKERNVTRAADRLAHSQPAMSGALKRLRDELKDQLLVRVGREMQLTPLAQALAISVPELINSIQCVLDTKLGFDPSTAKRGFNVAMSDYASTVLWPAVLRRFNEEAPYITCHVQKVDETTFNGIMGGDIDLFIGLPAWEDIHEGRAGVDLSSKLLFSDDFVCMVSNDHPYVYGELTLQQYREFPHGIVRFSPQSELLVEGALRSAGFDYQIGLTAPNFVSLILMLPHTRLIATVPRALATMLATTLPLTVYECPITLPRLDEVLVWHSRTALDPAHEYVRRVVQESAITLGHRVIKAEDNKLAI